MSQRTSTNHMRDPYLRQGFYVELFGHMLKPWSSQEFKQRFAENVHADLQDSRGKGDGITLAKMR